jgi:hypothetical protein
MIPRFLVSAFIMCAAAASALSDEGMWLFNNPPLKQLKEKHQFEPTPPSAKSTTPTSSPTNWRPQTDRPNNSVYFSLGE